MMTIRAFLVFFCFFIWVGLRAMQTDTGSLVIVGGGLEPDNREVFEALISKAGGVKNATFAVIPAAGGAPVQSFAYFRSELLAYGVQPGKIHLIPISMMDDDSTSDVNESSWKNNGNDTTLANLVRRCTAVWFTGGDQLRIVRTLIRGDGSPTPVLQAVWEVFRRGGVIGGTSAGAAVMSNPMIASGTSLAALEHGVIREFPGEDFPEDTGVIVIPGLGFFGHGMVDQHFSERARIGRLAVVLMNTQLQPYRTGGFRFGFGVDENTAMIYDASSESFIVEGTGGVTILDIRQARMGIRKPFIRMENLQWNYLQAGDSFQCATATVVPGPGRQPLSGMEKYSRRHSDQWGLFSPRSVDMSALFTRFFIDCTGADTVQTTTFVSPGRGFSLILRKLPGTRGYVSVSADDDRNYTITGAGLDIIPVSVTLRREDANE